MSAAGRTDSRARAALLALAGCTGTIGGAESESEGEGDACPPGEAPAARGGCIRPGRDAACGPGWVQADDGGCDPVLPEAGCVVGELPILGETRCQPIDECGDTSWGPAPLDRGALHVDGAADAARADGSAARPYATLDAALAAAAEGAQIAIAEGSYAGDVRLDRRLRLRGRCSLLVTIEGVGGEDSRALWVRPGGSGSEIAGVSITGPGRGLVVDGGRDVTLRETVVGDCGSHGVHVTNGGALAMRRVLVRDNRSPGVFVVGAEADLQDVVVRDTLPREQDRRFGRGIAAQDSGRGEPATLRGARVLLTGNRDAGLYLRRSEADLEDLVILATLPEPVSLLGGRGVNADGGSLSLSRAFLRDNRDCALCAFGASLSLRDVTVRDTLPRGKDDRFGIGVGVIGAAGAGGDADLRGLVLSGNRHAGLLVAGASARVRDSTVIGTLPSGDGAGGRGVAARPGAAGPADLLLARVRVQGGAGAAVHAAGSQVTLDGVAVVGAGDGAARGVEIRAAVRAEVLRTTIDRAGGAGLVIADTLASVRDCAVRGTRTGDAAGHGAVAIATPGATARSVSFERLLAEDNEGAGVVFHAAGGALRDSRVRGNRWGVVAQQGASPELRGNTVADDGGDLEVAIPPALPDLEAPEP